MKSKNLVLCMILLTIIMIINACSPSVQQSSPTQESVASTETTSATVVASTTNESLTEKQEDTTPEYDWQIDTSPIELTIFMNMVQLPDYDYMEYWGKNGITKRVTEETGVTPIAIYPPDSTGQRLNLMIASGDLPDIINRGTVQHINDLIDADLIYDIEELSRTEAPNFMNLYPKDALLQSRLTFDTMKLYALFLASDMDVIKKRNIPMSAWTPIIVKEIYEQAGSPEVKTGDDFIELMKKAQALYPDMHMHSIRYNTLDAYGNPNILKLAMSFAGVYTFREVDDQVKLFFDDPDYIAAIKFANRLFTEQVIWADDLLADESTRRGYMAEGKLFAEISQDYDNVVAVSEQVSASNSDFSHYIALDLFQLVPGKDPIVEGRSYMGGTQDVIPKGPNAGRALRFLEYLYCNNDIQRDMVFGTEGETYDMVDGEPVLREELRPLYKDNPIETRRQYGIHYFFMWRNDEWQGMMYNQVYGNPDYVEDALLKANRYAIDLSRFKGIDTFSADSEELKIQANIKEYFSGKITDIILSPSSEVEASYQKLLAELKNMGLDTLNEAISNNFIERAKKVQIYQP